MATILHRTALLIDSVRRTAIALPPLLGLIPNRALATGSDALVDDSPDGFTRAFEAHLSELYGTVDAGDDPQVASSAFPS